jgi:hypothetical protein
MMTTSRPEREHPRRQVYATASGTLHPSHESEAANHAWSRRAGIGTSACVHTRGSSGGVIVFYDLESNSVIRVPQGRQSLEDPCS